MTGPDPALPLWTAAVGLAVFLCGFGSAGTRNRAARAAFLAGLAGAFFFTAGLAALAAGDVAPLRSLAHLTAADAAAGPSLQPDLYLAGVGVGMTVMLTGFAWIPGRRWPVAGLVTGLFGIVCVAASLAGLVDSLLPPAPGGQR